MNLCKIDFFPAAVIKTYLMHLINWLSTFVFKIDIVCFISESLKYYTFRRYKIEKDSDILNLSNLYNLFSNCNRFNFSISKTAISCYDSDCWGNPVNEMWFIQNVNHCNQITEDSYRYNVNIIRSSAIW